MAPAGVLPLNLRRALRFVWQSGPGWTLTSVALLIVQGVLPLLALYLLKLVVDAVAAGLTAPDPGATFKQVALLVGLSALVALVSTLCGTMASFVNGAQAQVITDHMHTILHAKSIEIDLEYYDNPQYYDTLHRAQQEAPFRPTRILRGLLSVGRNGVSLLTIAGLLFWFHWGIVPILVIAAVPVVLVRLRYANKMYTWQRTRTPDERQAWYLNWMLTRDTHAKEIRLFGLGALFKRRFREVRRLIRAERLDLEKRRSIAEAGAESSATVAVFGVYAFVAYRTIQGVLTLGDLVMYFQAVQRGYGFLRDLLTSLADLYQSNLFLSNLYEFLDIKRSVIEPSDPKPVPRPMQTGIVFDRVSFQYPTGARKVLDDITLTIRPGEHVAFVGENGAGKTTLIKLLCRLYDTTDGNITLDGADLRHFQTDSLRREISVMFQDYVRYHLPARENIWLGNISLPPDEARITAAARHAGAHEVIGSLTHSYDTVLGKWFDGGEELSTGEWQKVALARAFLRDAQIIVLDEPTSAMDANAEYELFLRFHELVKGRTAILISHRLSTVRMADRIYVLEKGRIIESGSHEELVHRSGRYARLFETQAQSYR